MLRQTVRRLGATAQRTARVDFSPCLTVYSPQALRDNLLALQTAKSRDDAVIASVAKVVPTINWAEWEGKVPAEQLNAIKAEHEARKFPAPKVSNKAEAVAKFIAAYTEAIKPVTAGSEGLLKDMTSLKAKLEEDYITMNNWEPEDWARRFPGLIDKIRQRHLVGDITEDDHTAKYLALDSKALAEDVRAGKQISTELPADVKEYYFGGLATEGDFPNTPKDLLSKLNSTVSDDLTPAERSNQAYIRDYGKLWSELFSKIAPAAKA